MKPIVLTILFCGLSVMLANAAHMAPSPADLHGYSMLEFAFAALSFFCLIATEVCFAIALADAFGEEKKK